jgi:excisionase family DNA binding protein
MFLSTCFVLRGTLMAKATLYKYQDKMLPLKEAAQYIHIGKSTLYQCANSGKIRFYKPPVGQILFNVEDLDAWLDMSEIPAGTVKG